ncbi:MAG: GTPase HflX [Candidatus Omnitrophica bacterium]|nr:GTPase HflX [Candidatus Omnitrophota bacterium]MDD5671290.1 GTPase HflX [Candidatus Omnitrophota bacterium]
MPRDKAYLVIVKIGKEDAGYFDERLAEMKELTESAGGTVVGHSFVNLPHPSPSHFIREGKLNEVREASGQWNATLLIFNVDLSPGQARNIEEFVGIRAVDRTGLILDIFARRARSGEGKLQVELAQLNYLLPRLVGKGVIMSRLGGGIGTRGPGEQKLEVDRRKIRERIVRLRRDLEKLKKHRDLIREGRRQKHFIQVAIVGYTNAGKTTLLNALTGAEGYVEDKLFATLDPKTRVQKVRGGENVLFTDTVGFIRELPHDLVDAFHATLEEAVMADILIYVLDGMDPKVMEHKRVVDEVLKELKVHDKPVLYAINKIDLLTDDEKRRVQDMFPDGILISARDKTGIDMLLQKLSKLRQEFAELFRF